MAKLQI